MTIYADVLFIVNLVMNFFVLWVVAKLTRNRVKFRWIGLGALVMALLYTLLIALDSLRLLNVAVASVAILAVGVVVTFRPARPGVFFKIMIVAYIASFTLGGLGMSLIFLTDLPFVAYHIARDLGSFTQAISWQLAFAGVAISYILIKFGLHMAERYTLKRQLLCNVQVFLGENDASFEALVDTGHSLKEPLSKAHVIIAEFEHIKTFLPDSLKILFYEKNEQNLTGVLTSTEPGFHHRIRMIPFTSLGKPNGMLIGFRPDKVTVEGAASPPEHVVIGIYNDRLCTDGRYHALLSPELVN
ncbi:MAG: sigma-E processing peptidase SpoIIGA [Defluviitaleaceae bacterium]|nr:sigma-E processing peptidase SpoIIGA [Defluviitaleaceae bacterium]